jgi:hypothetical protein
MLTVQGQLLLVPCLCEPLWCSRPVDSVRFSAHETWSTLYLRSSSLRHSARPPTQYILPKIHHGVMTLEPHYCHLLDYHQWDWLLSPPLWEKERGRRRGRSPASEASVVPPIRGISSEATLQEGANKRLSMAGELWGARNPSTAKLILFSSRKSNTYIRGRRRPPVRKQRFQKFQHPINKNVTTTDDLQYHDARL